VRQSISTNRIAGHEKAVADLASGIAENGEEPEAKRKAAGLDRGF
jgi:hypothetical protein